MSKTDTGPPTEYVDTDEAEIEAALEEAWAEYLGDLEPDFEGEDDGEVGGGGGGGGGDRQVRSLPTSMYVVADIEWSGESRGVRASNFYGLELSAVIPAVRRAAAARARASAARPLASYRAKGWRAQVRHLQRTTTGRDALSGIAKTGTQSSWLRGKAPSGANRDRIDAAYQALRMRPVTSAAAAARTANHELAQELNTALSDAYNAPIRLFDIQQIDFHP